MLEAQKSGHRCANIVVKLVHRGTYFIIEI
jgi:hypothetical protein